MIYGVSGYETTPVTTGETVKTTTAEKSAADVKESTAVVYEKGSTSDVKRYTPNMEVVNKLKADALERANQLQSLVDSMFQKQGAAYASANVFTSDFWKQFSQNGSTVSEAAIKQAKEDISEDGYWGVKQTSSRIVDFAKALSGGDPDKIEELEKAFEKGYKQATKSWGDELPSLCKDTFDAVKQGFADWRKENAIGDEA